MPDTPPQLEVLIDADRIAARVAELGAAINAAQGGEPLVVVPVLKGSFVFAADLIRQLQMPVEVDFLGVRSYDEGTQSSGVVQITKDLGHSIEGRDVLLVEDIVDSGLTMSYLMDNLQTRHPRSVRLASLLHKPARNHIPVRIDYLGFRIEDVFVVGYGLDYNQQYRHLPDLARVTGEASRSS
ncbi:MAG: hypoxanthine phosphoribosyltransferase [Polyangiales bacterium]